MESLVSISLEAAFEKASNSKNITINKCVMPNVLRGQNNIQTIVIFTAYMILKIINLTKYKNVTSTALPEGHSLTPLVHVPSKSIEDVLQSSLKLNENQPSGSPEHITPYLFT